MMQIRLSTLIVLVITSFYYSCAPRTYDSFKSCFLKNEPEKEKLSPLIRTVGERPTEEKMFITGVVNEGDGKTPSKSATVYVCHPDYTKKSRRILYAWGKTNTSGIYEIHAVHPFTSPQVQSDEMTITIRRDKDSSLHTFPLLLIGRYGVQTTSDESLTVRLTKRDDGLWTGKKNIIVR